MTGQRTSERVADDFESVSDMICDNESINIWQIKHVCFAGEI